MMPGGSPDLERDISLCGSAEELSVFVLLMVKDAGHLEAFLLSP
jgi:hypothetical protein